jgi:L-ascorbate metabolism protein UlaG (beta-lactamase superfamily)
VLPANCREKALGLGLPENRIVTATPGAPLEIQGIRVEPLHALHGHAQFSVYRGANLADCGYLLTFGSWRIFQPGDTVLLQQHLELVDIHVLFFSPTIHNMFIDRSLILINALEPEHIFPQHFGTYRETEQNRYWTRGYPEEVRELLSPSLKRRFHSLDQGEVCLLAKD